MAGFGRHVDIGDADAVGSKNCMMASWRGSGAPYATPCMKCNHGLVPPAVRRYGARDFPDLPRNLQDRFMADKGTPHFHNDPASRSSMSGRRSSCGIGATPPDHPHVFLDMGYDEEIVCPFL